MWVTVGVGVSSLHDVGIRGHKHCYVEPTCRLQWCKYTHDLETHAVLLTWGICWCQLLVAVSDGTFCVRVVAVLVSVHGFESKALWHHQSKACMSFFWTKLLQTCSHPTGAKPKPHKNEANLKPECWLVSLLFFERLVFLDVAWMLRHFWYHKISIPTV